VSRFRRRPSPAFVLAIVALAVALGGTSFASNAVVSVSKLINGKKIKKNSIPANRVKKNSLTGKQIKESKLGRVPKAKNALNAANAANLGGKPAAAFETFAQQSIPAGTTVTGAFGLQHFTNAGTQDHLRQVISLPGTASANLSTANVNFANAAGVTDADPACNGTAAAPTAPAGKVCLYLTAGAGLGSTFSGEEMPPAGGTKFGFVVRSDNAAASGTGVYGIYAYHQP
jgi:hypothetical protein